MEPRPGEIKIDAEDRAAHEPSGSTRGGAGRGGTSRNAGHKRTRSMLARYSRFVGLMKVTLPAVAAALLGLVVIWPKVAPRDDIFRAAFADFNIKTVDTQAMVNPHYYGTDNQNVPFSVTANYATQVDPQNNVMSLDTPVADFTRKDGTGVILNADSGLFRQKDEILDLLGHVDLYQDNGFEMHTNSARLFVKSGDASGDEPTQAQGPSGTINGEGFRMQDRGRRVTFTGKCKAVLTMAKSGAKSGPKSGKASTSQAKPSKPKTGKDKS